MKKILKNPSTRTLLIKESMKTAYSMFNVRSSTLLIKIRVNGMFAPLNSTKSGEYFQFFWHRVTLHGIKRVSCKDFHRETPQTTPRSLNFIFTVNLRDYICVRKWNKKKEKNTEFNENKQSGKKELAKEAKLISF